MAQTRKGKYAKLEVSANGTTFNEILMIESYSHDGSSGSEKEAHWGNNGNAPEVPIDNTMKVSLAGFFDPTDAPTLELRSAWLANTLRYFKFWYQETDTTHTAYQGYVLSFKEDVPVGGLVKFTAELSVILSTYTTGVANA